MSRPGLAGSLRARLDAPAKVVPGPWVDALGSSIPVARVGEDPEGVHRLRVATRRLVTWIDLHPADGRAALADLRAGLKALRNAAGQVRDLDVQLAQPHPQGMLEWLADRRHTARPALVAAIDSDATHRLLAQLTALVPLDAPQAGRGLRRLAGKALRRGRAIGPDATDETFHDLRRKVRPVRYGLEWLDVRPGPVKALQDALGDLNDSAVGRALLVRWGGEPDPAEVEALRALAVQGRATSLGAWPGARRALRTIRRQVAAHRSTG